MAYTKQTKTIGFASMIAISEGAATPAKKYCNGGKDGKGAGLATASTLVDTKAYMSIKLPTSRETHVKAMAVGLEAANTILSSLLCVNPILPLVATLAIFKAMLDSKSLVLKDKE